MQYSKYTLVVKVRLLEYQRLEKVSEAVDAVDVRSILL